MIAYWPWLLSVLACPVMMWFMMRGMSRNDRNVLSNMRSPNCAPHMT